MNGETSEIADGTGLQDWLVANGYDLSRTAVLLNGKVVPRALVGSTTLSNIDEMEIVSFVGGG